MNTTKAKEINVGVHVHHCCNRHGCKYGDGANCPVEAKSVPGLYSCEQCDFEAESDEEDACDGES